MGDEEEVELSEEQQALIALRQALDDRMPRLRNAADFQAAVKDDVENLVFVAVVSSECRHSVALEKSLHGLAAPRSATKNARFFRLDVADAPDVAAALGIFATPTFVSFLKGEVRGAPLVSSNAEKVAGVFRNELIRRNEEMREYDLAKIAKPEEEAEEGEEGEEGEEDDA